MKSSDPFFKGYEFRRFKAGKLFKYLIFCSNDLSEVKKSFSTVKSSYPDSFIGKSENGELTRVK